MAFLTVANTAQWLARMGETVIVWASVWSMQCEHKPIGYGRAAPALIGGIVLPNGCLKESFRFMPVPRHLVPTVVTDLDGRRQCKGESSRPFLSSF